MPRGIRIPNPSKFIGSNDVEEFDTWMISLLRWIVLTRLVGPTNDDQRVQVVGSYLEGEALRWYNNEVTGLHCAKRTWTFEEVILGLFTRFVQATMMHVAVEKFEATTYDPKKGVQAYMAELQRWGLRMTQPPNSYTFRKKFLDSLPTTIIAKMIERGASPDMASLRRMVRVVQRVEDNKALMDYYVSSSRKTQPTESAYFTKRVKVERRSGGDRPPQRSEYASTVKTDGKNQQYSRTTTERPKASTSQNRGHKSYDNHRVTTESVVINKSNKDSKLTEHSKLCYACGKPGHYANDPTCKRYGKPRLFAI